MQTTECLYFSKCLCYLCVEEGMSVAGICRMITDIQKYKNDNLFCDQVLALLIFSNGIECEVVMKTVVILICILLYRCWKTNSGGYVLIRRRLLG